MHIPIFRKPDRSLLNRGFPREQKMTPHVFNMCEDKRERHLCVASSNIDSMVMYCTSRFNELRIGLKSQFSGEPRIDDSFLPVNPFTSIMP